MFQSLEFCRLNSYTPYYTVPWTHFYGSIVTPIPYKMKKYIKMKERYVTIIKKKKCEEIEKNEKKWKEWKEWKVYSFHSFDFFSFLSLLGPEMYQAW